MLSVQRAEGPVPCSRPHMAARWGACGVGSRVCTLWEDSALQRCCDEALPAACTVQLLQLQKGFPRA